MPAKNDTSRLLNAVLTPGVWKYQLLVYDICYYVLTGANAHAITNLTVCVCMCMHVCMRPRDTMLPCDTQILEQQSVLDLLSVSLVPHIARRRYPFDPLPPPRHNGHHRRTGGRTSLDDALCCWCVGCTKWVAALTATSPPTSTPSTSWARSGESLVTTARAMVPSARASSRGREKTCAQVEMCRPRMGWINCHGKEICE